VEAKILFIDDEANILDTFRRNLSRRFSVETALGPEKALEAIAKTGPYAVAISDLSMPGMDGIKLLGAIKELSPNTVRIMLTGHADLDAAMAAVNEGHVFRFLTKPCATETLIRTLEAAIEQYRLITAEKELLRGTLRGSVKVLTEILSLVNPEAFGRAERLKRLVVDTAKEMASPAAWKFELAAMLSQIGCISVPEEILAKKYSGGDLTPEEKQIYGMHVTVAVGLLENIPRLEDIIEIISRRCDDYDALQKAPLGARLLRLAEDYDDAMQKGLSKEDAVLSLRGASGYYGADALAAFERVVFRVEGFLPRRVGASELRENMILAMDLRSTKGVLVLAKGHELNDFVLTRLHQLAKNQTLAEPIDVLVPIAK
jgi:response regulator RpfG family c-di-GMP phosphodiesterase